MPLRIILISACITWALTFGQKQRHSNRLQALSNITCSSHWMQWWNLPSIRHAGIQFLWLLWWGDQPCFQGTQWAADVRAFNIYYPAFLWHLLCCTVLLQARLWFSGASLLSYQRIFRCSTPLLPQKGSEILLQVCPLTNILVVCHQADRHAAPK